MMTSSWSVTVLVAAAHTRKRPEASMMGPVATRQIEAMAVVAGTGMEIVVAMARQAAAATPIVPVAAMAPTPEVAATPTATTTPAKAAVPTADPTKLKFY